MLFNCRFYYPVFTVLFLDLGLSLSEFAGLNVLWAATIVLCEVPSGALADWLGRRRLVVAASWLMLGEMLTLCLMQPGHHDAVLALFVVNRILSGLAEAAASGADEALAYDSFPAEDRARRWPEVMARLTRWSSIGFIIAAVSGGFLYDAQAVGELFMRLGLSPWPKAWTMKIPLLLNLLTALGCVLVTRRMVEDPLGAAVDSAAGMRAQIRHTLDRMKQAARWIWHSGAALPLLAVGVVLDSVIRLFLTVSSNYYRLVGVEERWFGLISVAASLMGLAAVGLMQRMTRRHGARFNFSWLALIVLLGLLAVASGTTGWLGVALGMPLILAMRFLQFFLSHYLNEVVDSERRATVLSFRGLAMNLAYGGMTLLFALQTRMLRERLGAEEGAPEVFAAALRWWPGGYVLLLVVTLGLLALRRRRRSVA
ncbi:MAG: MFS transporter [Verrucomicrobiales bacterium]|nr:MFS transporter [Verrucomicrobiales bacterium]